MTCSNCFNGCAEITSDKCVKYTGLSIEPLGITNGDPLSKVEEQITTYLVSVLNGEGITPTFDPGIICTLISDLLVDYPNPNLVDILSVLIRASCSLQTQVTTVTDAVDIIEADYTVNCLTGVGASSGTHDILQAVITKLCTLNTNFGALVLNIATNYSSNGTQLDNYIANYLATHSTSTNLISNKMVPYVAYPFFGDLTGKFGANGVGIVGSNWENIYLCNGYNGLTPDMRGRMPIGDTDMMGSFPADAAVLPGGFNPVYTATPGIWTKAGANSITLTSTQVPNHTHSATAIASQAAHSHLLFNIEQGIGDALTNSNYPQQSVFNGSSASQSYTIRASATVQPSLGKSSSIAPGITVDSVTVNPTVGGGGAHANNQPAIACYYIMYIP